LDSTSKLERTIGMRGSDPDCSPGESTAEAQPNSNALIGYGDTHGTGPVGMALLGEKDSLLAVANGNRYYRNPDTGRISRDCRAMGGVTLHGQRGDHVR
jgi:hypothetical protein